MSVVGKRKAGVTLGTSSKGDAILNLRCPDRGIGPAHQVVIAATYEGGVCGVQSKTAEVGICTAGSQAAVFIEGAKDRQVFLGSTSDQLVVGLLAEGMRGGLKWAEGLMQLFMDNGKEVFGWSLDREGEARELEDISLDPAQFEMLLRIREQEMMRGLEGL